MLRRDLFKSLTAVLAPIFGFGNKTYTFECGSRINYPDISRLRITTSYNLERIFDNGSLEVLEKQFEPHSEGLIEFEDGTILSFEIKNMIWAKPDAKETEKHTLNPSA